MLEYTYDERFIQIVESVNGNDIEFKICIQEKEPYLEHLKRVQHYFDDNSVITDVLFYPQSNHEYKIIVRNDYYTDFVLELMKHKLLKRVEWSS